MPLSFESLRVAKSLRRWAQTNEGRQVLCSLTAEQLRELQSMPQSPNAMDWHPLQFEPTISMGNTSMAAKPAVRAYLDAVRARRPLVCLDLEAMQSLCREVADQRAGVSSPP